MGFSGRLPPSVRSERLICFSEQLLGLGLPLSRAASAAVLSLFTSS